MDEKWGIIQNKLMVSLIENLEQKATIYVFFLNCEVLDTSLVQSSRQIPQLLLTNKTLSAIAVWALEV